MIRWLSCDQRVIMMRQARFAGLSFFCPRSGLVLPAKRAGFFQGPVFFPPAPPRPSPCCDDDMAMCAKSMIRGCKNDHKWGENRIFVSRSDVFIHLRCRFDIKNITNRERRPMTRFHAKNTKKRVIEIRKNTGSKRSHVGGRCPMTMGRCSWSFRGWRSKTSFLI